MPYYLALDIGGTKTDYLLADETSELARVRTATIKRMRTDASTAAATSTTPSRSSPPYRSRSPANNPYLHRHRRRDRSAGHQLAPRSLRRCVSGDLILLGDVEIALDAAFQGGTGVLAMAGTGSNVAGRMPDGTLVTAGGWGPELPTRAPATRTAAKACAPPSSPATNNAPPSCSTPSSTSGSSPPSTCSSSTPTPAPPPTSPNSPKLILRCASEGDAVAAEVLRREGEDLAHSSASSSAASERARQHHATQPRLHRLHHGKSSTRPRRPHRRRPLRVPHAPHPRRRHRPHRRSPLARPPPPAPNARLRPCLSSCHSLWESASSFAVARSNVAKRGSLRALGVKALCPRPLDCTPNVNTRLPSASPAPAVTASTQTSDDSEHPESAASLGRTRILLIRHTKLPSLRPIQKVP